MVEAVLKGRGSEAASRVGVECWVISLVYEMDR